MAQVTNADLLKALNNFFDCFDPTDLMKKIEEHDHFINGNSKPGQKVINNQIDERLKTVTSNIERLEKSVDKLQTTITTFLIGVLLSGATWILFKVLPDLIRSMP